MSETDEELNLCDLMIEKMNLKTIIVGVGNLYLQYKLLVLYPKNCTTSGSYFNVSKIFIVKH